MREFKRLLPGLSGMVLCSGILQAQESLDPFYLLPTTGSGALSSASVEVDLVGLNSAALHFAFGFATDEQPAPSLLLDSFTVSLQDPAAPGRVAYFLTADGGGLQLAPSTPGAWPIDSQSIALTPVPFPGGLTSLSWLQAYEVVAPVPESLQNSRVLVQFDLFNNGDSRESLAWSSRVGVVPEPTACVLMLLGLGAGWLLPWPRRGKAQ